jgi:hypothetical protein
LIGSPGGAAQVVADDLDHLDGAEGARSRRSPQLVIVDLGHATMMPAAAWWVADLGTAGWAG